MFTITVKSDDRTIQGSLNVTAEQFALDIARDLSKVNMVDHVAVSHPSGILTTYIDGQLA